MNWENVNLESGYERDQNIIDPLNFDTLILEVYSNCREITESSIMQQFETDLKNRIYSAREVMKNNISNIAKQIQKERKDN